MKILLLLLLVAPASAQTLATVSGTAVDTSADQAANAAAIAQMASVVQQISALTAQGIAAAEKPAGHLDLTKDFAAGGWQSLTSANQAYGISKRFWHFDKSGQPLVNVGLFVGVKVPLVPLAVAAPSFLGGATVAVPGSTLDWALGTNWGAQWVPALKTGVLCAYDLTRPNTLHVAPTFVGIGAAYQFTLAGL